jgi:allantoicase
MNKNNLIFSTSINIQPCWKHDNNPYDGSKPLKISESLTADPDKHIHYYIDFKDPYTKVYSRLTE